MGTFQEVLLEWYQEEVLLYTLVSLVTVLATGTFFGFAADVLTRLVGIGSDRLTHTRETEGKH